MRSNNVMETKPINGFLKCPSVCRPGVSFYYHPEARIWIVKNPLTGDWFFEKEKFCEIRNKCVSVVSRIYFKKVQWAMAHFNDGLPIPY